MDDLIVLYTTWPDAETAEAFGRRAVEERLAACANVLAPMRSIYRWNGAIDRALEVPALFKTTTARAEALCAFLRERHPYEVPAIVALPIAEPGSNPAFLAWIEAEVVAAPQTPPA